MTCILAKERSIGSKREKTKKAASGVRNKKARSWAGSDSEKKLDSVFFHHVYSYFFFREKICRCSQDIRLMN